MRFSRAVELRPVTYSCDGSLRRKVADAVAFNVSLALQRGVPRHPRCSPALPSLMTEQVRFSEALMPECSAALLRGFCHGGPLRFSRQLYSVKRNPGSPTSDDQFVAYFRSVLRSTGPVPISKLASMVGDEYLERLGREGVGLAQFIRRHPEAFTEVQLPGRVHVAMSNEEIASFRTPEKKILGTRIIGLLTIAQQMPGTQVATSLGFSTLTPTVGELCNALRQWSLITPVHLTRFLDQFVEVFRIHPSTQQVRLRSVKSVAAPPQTLCATRAPPETRGSRFQLWLSTVVPSQYHIPLSYLLDLATTANAAMRLFESKTPSLEDMRLAFQALPPHFVDVRVFGNSPMAIFVRLLRPEPLLLQCGVPAYTPSSPAPEVAASRYDPTGLGRQLSEVLQEAAAKDELMHVRLLKGLPVTELRECLPAELLRAIEVFYGLVEGGDLRVSVLLLDRLRHLWEVQLDTCRVRPWAFLQASEQPSSLTLETSPVPRAMVHLQRMLADKGAQLPVDLFLELPLDLQEALWRSYAPLSGSVDSRNASPSASSRPLPDPLGEMIYTPRLAAEQQQRPMTGVAASPDATGDDQGTNTTLTLTSSVPPPRHAQAEAHMTEIEAAEFLHDAIPFGQPVMVDTLRNALLAEQHRRGVPSEKMRRSLRREFFERHRRLFTIYEYFAFDKLVVGRAEDPSPPPHVLQPRMTCIEHLIKFIALLSSNSATDGSITRCLPRDGRVLLKSIGSVTDLVEQLPMWFLVQRDKHNFSSSLIRYIGPQAESKTPSAWALKRPPVGVLTRKVPNNPFAHIGQEAVDGMPDGWHADWNEEDHEGFVEEAATTPPLP